jgi:hypothetical protein
MFDHITFEFTLEKCLICNSITNLKEVKRDNKNENILPVEARLKATKEVLDE